MIIDNKGKLFGKVSIIDILVILVVLGAAAGITYKFTKSKTSGVFVKQDDIQTVFYLEEVPEFAAKTMKVGDVVKDGETNAVFGAVKDVKVDKSVTYLPTSEGLVSQTSKPGYSSVYVTVEGKGVYSDTGITFGNVDYFIGQPINRFRVGNVGINYRIVYVYSMQKR